MPENKLNVIIEVIGKMATHFTSLNIITNLPKSLYSLCFSHALRKENKTTETFLVRTSGRYDFLDINFWNQAILT